MYTINPIKHKYSTMNDILENMNMELRNEKLKL